MLHKTQLQELLDKINGNANNDKDYYLSQLSILIGDKNAANEFISLLEQGKISTEIAKKCIPNAKNTIKAIAEKELSLVFINNQCIAVEMNDNLGNQNSK